MTFPSNNPNELKGSNKQTDLNDPYNPINPNNTNRPVQPYHTQALLPPNASQAQRDLVEACYLEPLMAEPMAYLQQLRHTPSAAVLKHRLWESGLEEVHRWIKDPQQALEWGQHWRNLLGTPQSVYMALSWLGINRARLHEGPLGERFYEVRLELNTRSNRYLEATKLTQYCLPVRSRLKRVYNGQARGPLVLGDTKQGLMKATLLQAEPGITIEGFGDIRFSFVQTHDPFYRLALKQGHSQQSEWGLGHYGNAFHLLGVDLLGKRQGLDNGVSHWPRISVRMQLNADEAQPDSQYSFWHLRFHSPLNIGISESRNHSQTFVGSLESCISHQGNHSDWLYWQAKALAVTAYQATTTSAMLIQGHTGALLLSHQHHLARGQAQQDAARGIYHSSRPPRGPRPLHFNHFEDSLCQAH